LPVISPNYFFVKKDFRGESDYNAGIRISDLFISGGSGIETQKDSLVIRMTENEIDAVRSDVIQLGADDLLSKYKIKESRDWTVASAKEDIIDAREQKIYYRPFDERWTLYSGRSKGIMAYPRREISRHMMHDNVALLVCNRQTSSDFQHVLVTDKIAERCSVSLQTGEVGYMFPLFLYQDDGTRAGNFHVEVVNRLLTNTTRDYEPEEIFDYLYGILHSPSYRKKYKEFLKIDFPRIPIPKSDSEMNRISWIGRELRSLHLMTSSELNNLRTTFPASGSDIVEEIQYWPVKSEAFLASDQPAIMYQACSVSINKDQFFGNVPEVAWNFYIGGYQPARKWLKDRRGRILSSDDILHYQKLIQVLIETNRIMQEID
jgi:predicted helicase